MDRRALIIIFASIAAFISISGIVVAIGMELRRKKIIENRLRVSKFSSTNSINLDSLNAFQLSDRIAHVIDLDLITSIMSDDKHTKLRSDLIKAGFFDPKAPVYFMIATAFSVLSFAVCGFVVVRMYLLNMPIEQQFLLMATFAYSGYFITDIFLRNRIKVVCQEYQSTFPDYLDLLVVCVDAGLSLNAALDRVTLEFYPRSKALSTNFSVMLQEIRIGRETTDALDNLSARIDVDEIVRILQSYCCSDLVVLIVVSNIANVRSNKLPTPTLNLKATSLFVLADSIVIVA